MSTIVEQQRVQSRAHNEAAGQAGKRWVTEKAAELARLPAGTVVVIDVETGAYVTGETAIEAMDAYDRTIGPDRTGYVHRIGRPTFLGGGLAQG